MKRLAVVLALVLVLIATCYWIAHTAGLLPPADGRQAADQTRRAWWQDVERPAYFDVEIDAVDGAFESRLKAALPEIERARDVIDDLAESERYKILAGPGAPLYKDALLAYRDHLESIADVYRERTDDTGEARRLGEEFISKYLDRWAQVPPVPDARETADLGTAAREAGSEDPLLTALHYQMWLNDPEYESQVLDVLQTTGDRLEADGYPAEVVMTVRGFAWDLGRTDELEGKRDARRYLLVDAAVRYLVESADDPQPRFVWWRLHYFLEMLEERDRRAVYVGALAEGTYNEFSLHMLAGRIYRDMAWEARGGGFAHTVSRSGWEDFSELMPHAAQHFMRAWLLHPSVPEAPEALIEMGYTGGDERWDAVDWFHVAVRSQLDHYAAYDALLWSMTPRWGGSHQEQLAFAHKCLDTDRWDTGVPAYAFRVLLQINRELGDGYPFGKLPGVMDVVDRYVAEARQGIAKGQAVADAWATNWAFAAALYAQAGRYEDAHALFAAFGDGMSQQDFNWAGTKFTHVRGLCAAMTGPANVELPALRRWVEEPLPKAVLPEDLDPPLAHLARLRELDDRDVVRPYWDDVAATLQHLQTYHRGEWVDFTPDENLSGMVLITDTHEVSEDGTLRIASAANSTGAALRSMGWFEPPLLVEGEVGGWPEHPAESDFGVHSGWPHSALYGDQHWRGIVLFPERTHAAIVDSEDKTLDDRAWAVDADERTFHHLRLKLWPGAVDHYSQYWNLHADEDFDRDVSGRVFFGGRHTRSANSGQLRNLRLRKLNERPPKIDSSDPEFLQYWRREHEFDPRDAEANLFYGAALNDVGQHGEALRHLRLSREVNPNRKSLSYVMGKALVSIGRTAEGVAELEEAVKAEVIKASAGYLSWVFSSVDDPSLRDPKRAMELAELSRERLPDDWRTFRALAAAHARVGNFDQAADWMRQAITAMEEDPDQQRHADEYRGYLKTIEAGEAIVMRRDE